jgi:hypothetical protein
MVKQIVLKFHNSMIKDYRSPVLTQHILMNMKESCSKVGWIDSSGKSPFGFMIVWNSYGNSQETYFIGSLISESVFNALSYKLGGTR